MRNRLATAARVGGVAQRFVLSCALFVAALSVATALTNRLDQPPPDDTAQWWSQDWASVDVSKKAVKAGERFVVTGIVLNGGAGEPRWGCSYCNWITDGTSEVLLRVWHIVGELEKFGPQAVPGTMDVTVEYWNWTHVIWSAAPPPATPAPHEGPDTYCYCGGPGGVATIGPGPVQPDPNTYPTNYFPKYTVVRAFFKVPDDCPPQENWSTAAVEATGNIGTLGWSDGGDAYFLVGGEIVVELQDPIPGNIPADGHTLVAIPIRCFLRDNRIPLGGQRINVRATAGSWSTADPVFAGHAPDFAVSQLLRGKGHAVENSVKVDQNGYGVLYLASSNYIGPVDIWAYIDADVPVRDDHATVIFRRPTIEIEASAAPDTIAADGATTTLLTARVKSEGYPLPGASMIFEADKGALVAFSDYDYGCLPTAGPLWVSADDTGLCQVVLVSDETTGTASVDIKRAHPLFLDRDKATVTVDFVTSPPLRPMDLPAGDADLTIIDLETSPSAAPGGDLPIHFEVRNTTDTPAAGFWRDAVYLSDDTVIGGDRYLFSLDRPFDFENPADLATSETYVQDAAIGLPKALAGPVWVVVVVNRDGDPAEADYTDNAAIFGPVTIGKPDLRVTGIDLPDGAALDRAFYVTWTVQNDSATTLAGRWVDRLSLSTDDQPGSDSLLNSVEVDRTVPPGDSYQVGTTVTLPNDASSGDVWLVAVADGPDAVVEENEDNNDLTSGSFAVSLPDLIPSAPSGPVTVKPEEIVEVSWTTTNQGAATARGPWLDAVFLSQDEVFGGDKYLGGIERTDDLAPGAHYDVATTFAVAVEQPEGTFYLLVVADKTNELAEDDEDNNVATSGTVTSTRPNLLVEDLVVTPTALSVNAEAQVTWRVRSNGPKTAEGPWQDRVVLSMDDRWTSDDLELAVVDSPTTDLGVGEWYDSGATVTLPEMEETQVYILVKSDYRDVVIDADVDDDITSSGPHGIYKPNLTPVAMTVPAAMHPGQEFVFQWRIANIGQGAMDGRAWTEKLRVSTDDVLTWDDPYVAEFWHNPTEEPPIEAGSYADRVVTTTIPAVPAGDYHWYLYIQDALPPLPETNFDDNGLWGETTSTVTLPNVVAVSVSAPSSAVLGQGLPIVANIQNQGPVPIEGADRLRSRFFLSDDPNGYEGGDYIASSYTDIAGDPVDPDETVVQMTTPTLWSRPAGDYYLFLHADSESDFIETNEDDNVTSTGPIAIDGVDLAVGNVTPPTSPIVVGQPLAVTYRVTNLGGVATDAPFKTVVYVGDDDFGWETLFSDERTTPLAPGEFYDVETSPVCPTLTQDEASVYARTDSQNDFVETDEDNNRFTTGPATVIGPDLVVLDATVSTDTISSGILNTSWTVSNAGLATATLTWADCIYVGNSANPTWGATRARTTTPSLEMLAPGDWYTTTVMALSPVAGSQYYVILWTDPDDTQPEKDLLDNVFVIGRYEILASPGTPQAIRDFLLGVTADPSFLDANGDGVIDIADFVFRLRR